LKPTVHQALTTMVLLWHGTPSTSRSYMGCPTTDEIHAYQAGLADVQDEVMRGFHDGWNVGVGIRATRPRCFAAGDDYNHGYDRGYHMGEAYRRNTTDEPDDREDNSGSGQGA